jgi:hypothetical protein
VMITCHDTFHDVTNELFLRSVFELACTRLETDSVLPRSWNNLLFGIRSCHLSSEYETVALWGLRVVLALCSRWQDGRKVCYWSFKLLLITSLIGIEYVRKNFMISSDVI